MKKSEDGEDEGEDEGEEEGEDEGERNQGRKKERNKESHTAITNSTPQHRAHGSQYRTNSTPHPRTSHTPKHYNRRHIVTYST